MTLDRATMITCTLGGKKSPKVGHRESPAAVAEDRREKVAIQILDGCVGVPTGWTGLVSRESLAWSWARLRDGGSRAPDPEPVARAGCPDVAQWESTGDRRR